MNALAANFFRCAIFLAVATTTAWALTEENVSEKRTVTPGGKLVVDVDFGTIDVSSAAGNTVMVTAQRRVSAGDDAKEKEFLAAAPITVTLEGNTVTVRARRAKNGEGWSWRGSSRLEAKYTITVPEKFNVQLDTSGGGIAVNRINGETRADTSGGSLTFSHLRGPLVGNTSGGSIKVDDCVGVIRIETSGGKIEVTGGSGSVNANTSGGSIAVRNFGGDAKVETSGGGLRFENVRGEIRGETSGGSIAATISAPVPGDVRLETSAGRIEINLPADAALNVDAETSLGRVTSDLPVTVQGRQERDRLRGTINGGGKLLVLRTSAGGISLKQGSGAAEPAKP
jgi:DUF4097 and DUF4098 domain-containing protein YvlB